MAGRNLNSPDEYLKINTKPAIAGRLYAKGERFMFKRKTKKAKKFLGKKITITREQMLDRIAFIHHLIEDKDENTNDKLMEFGGLIVLSLFDIDSPGGLMSFMRFKEEIDKIKEATKEEPEEPEPPKEEVKELQYYSKIFTEERRIDVYKNAIKYEIEYLTAEEFEEKYPKWYETNNNKYDNLPNKLFILIDNNPRIMKYVAIDNQYNEAFTEEFNTLDEAIRYLLDMSL